MPSGIRPTLAVEETKNWHNLQDFELFQKFQNIVTESLGNCKKFSKHQTMADKIAEMRKDIFELEALQKQASRVKVKDILSIEIRKLVTEVVILEDQQRAIQNKTTPMSAIMNKCYEVKLNNYAWHQSTKFLQFYVSLKNVHTLPPENVTCIFTPKSLELKVKALGNKDYVLKINKLLHDIDPEASTWKLKTGTVVLNVAKVEEQDWSHVTEIEKRVSDAKKLPETDKSADPSEGLMSIMKNMYQQGDDEMKRTIAKAWTESQQKGPTF